MLHHLQQGFEWVGGAAGGAILAATETLALPNGFSAIGWVLVALAALSIAVSRVWDLIDRMRAKNAPPGTYASASALRELRDEIRAEMDEIRQDIRARAKTEAEARSRLYTAMHEIGDKLGERIGTLAENIAHLKGRLGER